MMPRTTCCQSERARETFEPAQVEREMRVIADDLHCDAVRISGGDPERISVAARYAIAAGLEVWFSPFPCDMGVEELRPYFAECADRAEELRKDGAPVVLVNGCEISLFANGFFPGASAMERIHNVTHGGPELWAFMPDALGRAAAFLGETLPAGTYAGLAMILVGLAVVVMGQRRSRSARRRSAELLAELGTD